MNRGRNGVVASRRLGYSLVSMLGAIALATLGSAYALESPDSGELTADLGSNFESHDLSQVGDGVWECTVYFAGGGCTPGDEDCYYYGRDPNRTAAEDEALEECKFSNRMQGRSCRRQGCTYIPRP